MPLITPEAAEFREYIIEELRDPEGIHHEFSQGLHGRKIEFEGIPVGGEKHSNWVDLNIIATRRLHPGRLPEVVLGIDSGTNDVVEPIAKGLGRGVTALKTVKISKNQVELDPEAQACIQAMKPMEVQIVEDVATRGTASASAVLSCRAAGVKIVTVLNTVQRAGSLGRLDEIGAEYHSIIDIPERDFTAEQCLVEPEGYCARGWDLILHGASV